MSDKLHDTRQWGRYTSKTFEHISPLYTTLSRGIEEDPEIQSLVEIIDRDQPLLVMFFSAVNFLLLRDTHHALAEFYPVLSTSPRPAREAYPFFHDFCLSHADELRKILPTARLQTNEVTRCANLLPAFELVYRRGRYKPLAMIEIGASAGLNLNWDRYQYRYGRSISTGDVTSPVQIQCILQGKHTPPLPKTMPPVAQRIGIDLFPLDVNNERDMRWLSSCIWPEETERYHLLLQVTALTKQRPPQVLAGDACHLLPEVLATLPEETALCLWHSYALMQGPAHVRKCIETILADYSCRRDLYRISLEMNPAEWDAPRLELFTYKRGDVSTHEWLATCEVHGDSMEWLLPVL